MGQTLGRTGAHQRGGSPCIMSVKEAVLPFDRFPDVDTLLGAGDEVHR